MTETALFNRASTTFSAVRRAAIELLFPQDCVCCHASYPRQDEISGLCPDCATALKHLPHPQCEACGTPIAAHHELEGYICGICRSTPPPYDSAASIFKYCETARRLLWHYKFRQKPFLTGSIFALMRPRTDWLIAKWEPQTVVTVPLHWKRLFSRGYDQAHLLGRKIAERYALEFIPGALTRTRNTDPQFGLKRKERKRNITGSLQLNHSQIQSIAGKRVLLFDDVFTTGATALESAKVLGKAKPASIFVLTFARSVPD